MEQVLHQRGCMNSQSAHETGNIVIHQGNVNENRGIHPFHIITRLSEWLNLKWATTLNICDDVELLEPSHYWWELEMWRPIWKKVWKFPVELNTYLPCDAEFHSLIRTKRNENIFSWKDLQSNGATLFVIAPGWKQR